MDITGLPATALKAVGAHLAPPDAAACRLASKLLAAVSAPQNTQGHVQVVASYFQSQLQKHREKEGADAPTTAAAIAASTTVAWSRMIANEPTTAHLAAAEQAGDARTGASRTAAVEAAPAGDAAATTPLASFQDMHVAAAAILATEPGTAAGSTACVYHPPSASLDNTQPSSSSTTPSSSSGRTEDHSGTSQIPALASTAKSLARAAAAYSRAVIYIDADMAYHEDTWQQLFSALACCTSVRHLQVIQCKQPTTRNPPTTSHWQAATAASFAWLPAFVSFLKPQLQQLQLNLVDSLPGNLQPLLLELKGLQTLDISGSNLYSGTVTVHPTLLPGTVVRLSQLKSLQLLKCRMGAVEQSNLPDTVVQLQQTFKQLGKTLTQLDFGLADRSQQIALSAPLLHMPLLQSLTCQPGFTLDAEDILYPDLDLDANIGNLAQPGSSGSTSLDVQVLAPAVLVPSLTRLSLNEGFDHGPLLRLLAQGTPAAAAASRTLLQHVELNSPADVPFELLGKLSGLCSLKFGIWGKHGGVALRDLAAQTSLASQLSGLTVVCNTATQGCVIDHRPVTHLSALTSLTSLHIVGAPAMHIVLPEDVQTFQATMPGLSDFSFVGSYAAGDNLCDAPSLQAHHAKEFDANQLKVLDLDLHAEYHGVVCLKCLGEQQRHLTSLKVTGCCSCIGTGREVLQEMKPDSSSSTSSAGQQRAGSTSSSGGQLSAGCSYPWPDLVQLAVSVDGLAAAEDYARLNRALPDLTLHLRPELDTPCAGSLWDEACGPMPGLADLWPHLTSLRLTVPGCDYIHAPHHVPAEPKGVDTLLLGLSRLTRLEHLSLTCYNDSALEREAILHPDCVPSFAFLHSLTRLQTLELNFRVPCVAQGPVPQTVSDELSDDLSLCNVHELARFWEVLAGSLQRCSRLRRLGLDLGRQFDLHECHLQQLLQRSVSNCVVCVRRESLR